jgi:hypothetical protein
VNASPKKFDLGRGDVATRCRAPVKGNFMRFCHMRVLSTIRSLLLAFAVLGLLIAPAAAFAHRDTNAVNDGVVASMMDQAPCCPHHKTDDCAKCALVASCATHCVDFAAVAVDLPTAAVSAAAHIISPLARSAVGIKHSPPRKPPR